MQCVQRELFLAGSRCRCKIVGDVASVVDTQRRRSTNQPTNAHAVPHDDFRANPKKTVCSSPPIFKGPTRVLSAVRPARAYRRCAFSSVMPWAG
mmetsp:Transcript_19548/g.45698  ORF Transcript_19548/g.45698 Transcript_19548/m.45698 type:complete len:94 (+) Transcript_19548:168-449(+)